MAGKVSAKAKKTDDKTLSEDQQNALVLEEIQRFIKISKENGEVSIAEINELLPPEIILASVLDSFMRALEVNGVNITEVSENSESDDDDDLNLLNQIKTQLNLLSSQPAGLGTPKVSQRDDGK